MMRVYHDADGDVVFVLFGFIYFTFYKAYQNRKPIITFFREVK